MFDWEESINWSSMSNRFRSLRQNDFSTAAPQTANERIAFRYYQQTGRVTVASDGMVTQSLVGVMAIAVGFTGLKPAEDRAVGR